MEVIKNVLQEIQASNEIKVYMVGIEEPGNYDAIYLVGNQDQVVVYHIDYNVKVYSVNNDKFLDNWYKEYQEFQDNTDEIIDDILVNKYIDHQTFLEHLTYAVSNYVLNDDHQEYLAKINK